jgi:hypothetical protein
VTIRDGELVGLVPDTAWAELEYVERQFLLTLDDCLAGRFPLSELRRVLTLRIGRPLMDDRAFDLLLNDDAHLERIASGDFVVVDATMSSEQVKRLAEHLLKTRKGDVVGRYETELHALEGPVLGLCPHGVDLDRAFCSEGCRV